MKASVIVCLIVMFSPYIFGKYLV